MAEEEAAVLALAELGRGKGVGEERVVSAAREFYPLWTVPWEEHSLIYDGLGTLARTFRYERSLDPARYIGRLRESMSNREAFVGVLSDGRRVLESFAEETIDLGSLAFDSTTTSGTLTYLEYGRSVDESDVAMIPPHITLESAQAYADVLTSTLSRVSDETEAFKYAVTFANQGVALHLRKLEREIASVKDTYDPQIEAIRPAVEKRVAEIERQYEREIRKAESERTRVGEVSTRERGKLKAEADKLLRELDGFEKKRQAFIRRGDSRGERGWWERGEGCRARTQALSTKIADLDRRSSAEDDKLRAGIGRLQERRQASIAAEEGKVRTIAAKRDSEIELRLGEDRRLRSQLSTMIARMTSLIDRRVADQRRLELLRVPRKTEQSLQLLIPFYSVVYLSSSGERFSFLSPAAARSTGIVQKTFGGAVPTLKSKMEMLLTPLSNELQYMICTGLAELVKRDAALRGVIYEIGQRQNLLTRPDARDRLRLGLEQLSSEGWLGRVEAASIEAAILSRK